MIYILAVFLPFLAVMLKGKIGTGIVLLLLQLTVFGWIPAIAVAWIVLWRTESARRHHELVATIKTQKA